MSLWQRAVYSVFFICGIIRLLFPAVRVIDRIRKDGGIA